MPASSAEPAPVECRLRDGARALIRPVAPEDKWRLREGLRQLSPASRYLRFHTAMTRLTEEQLRYLTEIDYHDHMAWVALDAAHPERPGMGVGRYVRLKGEPGVAEAAITVADHYQGLGLGTILFGMLARSARENGITTFRNYVLAENTGMLELLDQLGAHRTDEGAGVYRVDVPLPDDLDDLPDTPGGRVFKAVARGDVAMLHMDHAFAEEERR